MPAAEKSRKAAVKNPSSRVNLSPATRKADKEASFPFSARFIKYIEKIRSAKISADEAVSKIPTSSLTAARASLAITWEAVFDYCCESCEANSLSRLNSLAGVIHKLAASNLQLKNMESRFGGDSFSDCEVPLDSESMGLDDLTVSKIEERLNLL